MRWYEDLYIGYNALDNRDEIINKIKEGQPQLNKYVLTLPFNDTDVLDIYPSYVLQQKCYLDSDIMIIGFAEGIEEAYDMMQLAIMECYSTTGNFKVKQFINANDQQLKEKI